jgi:hypothetical protein
MKEFELEPGEHVVKEARKHWFIFLLQLLPFAILALLPLALPRLLEMFNQPLWSTVNWGGDGVIRLLLATWWLFIWTAAWLTFTRYFLNLWVVTNFRIVDIHQKGFFRREVSSLLLNRVQDITVDTEGILVSLLDIGDINVQSAGAVDRFSMRGIPHPAQMRDIILKYVSTKPSGDTLGA